MQIITDFGRKNIKPKKTFYYREERFAICEVPTKLNDMTSPTVLRRLVHFSSGKVIPIQFLSEKTALNCVQTAEKRLDKIFKTVGEEYFYSELSKQEKLN